jgi:hypothetical protein
VVTDENHSGGDGNLAPHALCETGEFPVGLERVRAGTERIGWLTRSRVDADARECPSQAIRGVGVPGLDGSPLGTGVGVDDSKRRPGECDRSATNVALDSGIAVALGDRPGVGVAVGPRVAAAEGDLPVRGPDTQDLLAVVDCLGDQRVGPLVVGDDDVGAALEDTRCWLLGRER